VYKRLQTVLGNGIIIYAAIELPLQNKKTEKDNTSCTIKIKALPLQQKPNSSNTH
jgi:hypothetical protein